MRICLITSAIMRVIPQFQIYLKFIGAPTSLAAYRALSARLQVGRQASSPLTFANGFHPAVVNQGDLLRVAAFTGF